MTRGLSRQNPSAEPPGDQEGHGEEELLWGRQRNAKPVPSHPVLVTWNPGRRAVATWGGGSEGTRGRCQYYTTSKAHSVNLSYSPSPFPPPEKQGALANVYKCKTKSHPRLCLSLPCRAYHS